MLITKGDAMDRENMENWEVDITNKATEIVVDEDGFQREIYFEIIQNLFDDTLFSVDIKNKVLYHNGKKAAAEFGLPPVVENFPMSLATAGAIYPEDLGTFMGHAYDMLAGNSGLHEIRIRKNDGTFEWFRVQSTVLKNTKGEVIEVLGRLTNIQELMEIKSRAMTDSLTKAQNRMTFEENVQFTLSNCKNESHALFFIDLDDFKYINDNFGHGFGDFVLKSLADRIRNRVQKHDFIGRVGGDEFLVLMKDIEDIGTIRKRADQLLEDLRSEYSDGENAHTVKVSIGVARYPMDGHNYDELYRKADKALYHSKALGKDISTLYTESF